MLKAESWRKRWAKRSAKVRILTHPMPWGSVALVLFLIVILPTVADVGIARIYPEFLRGLQYFITTIYLLTSLMLLAEAWAAFRAGHAGFSSVRGTTTDESPGRSFTWASMVP